jgi:SEC-C motif
MPHKKLSRNASCPCGSGKKYKTCCWDKGFEWVEDERGRTCLEYDKPSSLFAQFNDARIAPVASMLDRKLEDLVTTAIR